MTDYVSAGRSDEIAPGQMKLIEVDGEEVVIANVNGEFYAFGNECTHAGGPLGEGELAGDRVTCPWHSTIFDVKTGAAITGPGHDPVPTYNVRVVDGEVQVGAKK